MDWIDLVIIACPLLLLFWVAWYTRRYARSVVDFLSGGRQAGRYLLAVARSEQGSGAVVFAAFFETIAVSGFVLNWWSWMTFPIILFVAISGWVIYRFRETRALTLAQFFEVRYSKAFRLFMGFLGFGAGLANFGIIPVVGARFLTYMLGLPRAFHIHGQYVPTYIPVMAVFLTVTLLLSISGGLVTLMITNCLEGIISQVLFLVIIAALLWIFSWSQISEVMTHTPPGYSLVNPFDASKVPDFNVWMTLMGVLGLIYRTMAWQNQSAYQTASLTAHESRMGNIMTNWRALGQGAVITLLAVCALTYLHHPAFAAQARVVMTDVHSIPQPQIQEQMTLPLAVTHMLPVGVRGALCVVLLMGVFGGDGTHLLSWGSIFIQDCVLPFRRKPFTPRQHIILLRWSMIGVAVFAFIFGSFFHQTEYIPMWWAVTEAIFVGGAGCAIIGGLYWKKGTTAGAWAGALTGSILATGSILLREFYGNQFPLNGVQISFFGSIIAMAVYAGVSLLTCRENYDMDRLLHRGKYAIVSEQKAAPKFRDRLSWSRLIGIDEQFSRGDKWITGGLFGWSLLWLAVFVVGTAWNFVAPWSTATWSNFWWFVAIVLPVFFCVVTGVWFTWGGIVDMRDFFRRLKEQHVNLLDNGMVVDHRNLDEARAVTRPKRGEKS